MKKRAREIWLRRAEGRFSECVETVVRGPHVWASANAVLRKWSHTAPGEGGGYHKCDFRILWEGVDGDLEDETYEGRFDLTKHPETLERHILDFCECYSGRRKPTHMKSSDYERFLVPYMADGTCAAYGRVLDEYEIGDAPEPKKSAQEAWIEAMGG